MNREMTVDLSQYVGQEVEVTYEDGSHEVGKVENHMSSEVNLIMLSTQIKVIGEHTPKMASTRVLGNQVAGTSLTSNLST